MNDDGTRTYEFTKAQRDILHWALIVLANNRNLTADELATVVQLEDEI